MLSIAFRERLLDHANNSLQQLVKECRDLAEPKYKPFKIQAQQHRLPKLNRCTSLDGKLRFIPLNSEITVLTIAAQSNLPAIGLEIVDGTILCLYLFSKLYLFSSKRKKQPLASGSFKYTNMQLTFVR
jgi:hypothetical protein